MEESTVEVTPEVVETVEVTETSPEVTEAPVEETV